MTNEKTTPDPDDDDLGGRRKRTFAEKVENAWLGVVFNTGWMLIFDKQSRWLLGVIAGCLITILILLTLKYAEWRTSVSSASLEQQLQQLTDTERALANMTQFVHDQQKRIKETQRIIDEMKSEQERLKPVLEADRQVVEAVLATQAARAQSNVWLERSIGFVTGVLGSMIATYLCNVWRIVRRQRRKERLRPSL